MKEFSKRVISGIIGLLLLITVISKGGYTLHLSVYLISIIGLREFYKAMNHININPISLIGYIFTTGLYLNILFTINYIELIFAIITIILLLLTIINRDITIEDISITVLGVLYIPFLLSHVIYLDKSIYIWLIFIIAFGSDTFAYISGNLFGKRKLYPEISPNKTVEGAIGGVIGSSILVSLFSVHFNLEYKWRLVLLSVICSILSQMGDLVASKIKRRTGIKDYGFIMPGHGGVLDRFDSIILSAPVIYYYISSFLN